MDRQAIVAQIQAEQDPAHLVSIVKGEPHLTNSASGMASRRETVAADELPVGSSSPWHVFNDFLVRPVSEEEALSFPGTWKVRTHFTPRPITAGCRVTVD
jgi:PAB-dependent poly(A)-specific ribonuclease subunit 2